MIPASVPSIQSVRRRRAAFAVVWLLALFGTLLPARIAVAQSPERIQFARGATSAVVNGSVNASNPKRYVLRALAGQNMTVQTNSTGPFRLSISGADGSRLGYANANEAITVRLPKSQDYYIALAGPAGAPTATYSMRVTVVSGSQPPTPTPISPQPQPQRIRFAPGAVSATVYGSVDVSHPVQYVLRALAGQDMTVQAYGGGPYRFTVTGADGSFLGRADAGGTVQARLPRTQDYFISFEAPTDVPRSNFTLTVTVVGSTPAPPPQTERIQFAPGATSATVYGVTPKNYILRALGGQSMVVELFTNGLPARATVRAQNGQVLGSASQSDPWSGYLPATQDYSIYVEAPADSSSANFTMRVSIY